MASPSLNAAVLSTIREYCAGHPNAADTLEGVHRWWLGDLACSFEDLRRVLEHLVTTGALDRRTLVAGTEIYFVVRDGSP